jgi:hypothetical protein
VANVLDVRRVRPGTLLVDDSEPHSFETTAAFARWNTEHDVLFSDAGLLRSPDEVTRIVYVPADLQDVIPMPAAEDNASSTITGCVLSSLLTAKLGYPETIGPVTLDAALTHFRGVVDAGFGAAWPQCAGRALAPADVASFCERHAGKETT